MSRRERAKGVSGEQEVATAYRLAGFMLDRVPNSGGLRIKGDLYGDVPEHVEVKRQEVFRIPLWTAQAEAECNGLPWTVVFRRSRAPWYAVTTLDRHLSLVSAHGQLYDGRAASTVGGSP